MEIETEVLRQVVNFRPEGLLRPLKMIEMKKLINSNLPVALESDEIIKILDKYYIESYEVVDFELPWDEFGEMIEKQRKSEIESVQEEVSVPGGSSANMRKRSTRKK